MNCCLGLAMSLCGALLSVPLGAPQDPIIVESPIEDAASGRAPRLPRKARTLAELLSQRVIVGGCPDQASDLLLAERLRDSRDHEAMWSATQGLRLRDHVHYGSIWMHDAQAEQILAELIKSAEDPVKRAFAADALGDFDALRAMLLDADLDPALRAFAASLQPAPHAQTAANARGLLDAWWPLLEHADEHVRYLAAKSLGPWIYDSVGQARLFQFARQDPSLQVREALFDTIAALGLVSAHEFFAALLADTEQKSEVHALARKARARLAIH